MSNETPYLQKDETLVACDGRKLLVLRNEGTRQTPHLVVRFEKHRDDVAARDLGTDRPGRVQPSVGTSGSAVEQTDFHEMEEEAFLQAIAAELSKMVTSGMVGSLVVVAPPRALGYLRQSYTETLRQAIRLEIDRDFVGMPVQDIQAHFQGE